MLAPIVVLVLGAALYALTLTHYNGRIPNATPVQSDGEGYYAYLPAYILDHDPSFRQVIVNDVLPIESGRGVNVTTQDFGFWPQPTGNYLDKYGVGTAMLMLPFFLVGHAVAVFTRFHADGYSIPEEITVGVAALVYTALGLFALRSVLLRWFSTRVVAVVLVLVTFGTGMVQYFTQQPSISHDYEFFAVSVLLLCALRWYESPQSWRRVALFGLTAGLVVAIRLTNVVLVPGALLLGVGGVGALWQRLALFARFWSRAAVAVLCACGVLIPQVLTWRVATGHLVVRSYPGENFYFTKPQLLQSLVWLNPHGLLPYYPVVGFAFIGLGIAWFKRRDLAVPVTLSLLLVWYVISSWWDWSFANALGNRAWIDALPYLALPMALCFASIRPRAIRAAAAVVVAACVYLTMALTVAYWQGRVPGAGLDAGGILQILEHPRQLLTGPKPY